MDDIIIDKAARSRLASAMEQLKAQMTTLAESQRQMAQLIATGSAGNSRVTVVVNAQGMITETKFANDIDDLDYPEIATAVTQAHQKAVAELTRKRAELMGPVHEQTTADTVLEDLVPGLPDPVAPLTALVQPATEQSPVGEAGDGADRPGVSGVLRRSW